MNKKNIMNQIAESNKSVIEGVDKKDIKHWATVYIMGQAHQVPADLTVMQAMEYAGYKFTRSCGCRAGFCGACATIYRMKGDYKLQTAMACQTRVEDGMFLVQLPFQPADKPLYNVNEETYDENAILKYFPEVARCVSCNTCTKACPQDLDVMDYIQASLRGDYKRVSELSFDCIQCGLCAIRCPAEIVQYNVAQFARRMYGKYGFDTDESLKKRVENIKNGDYEKEFTRLLKMDTEESKEEYKKQHADKAKYLKKGGNEDE